MVKRLATALGFVQVSLSSALVPMVRAVPRGLTATVDAYLTPVIKDYLTGFLSGEHILTQSLLLAQQSSFATCVTASYMT